MNKPPPLSIRSFIRHPSTRHSRSRKTNLCPNTTYRLDPGRVNNLLRLTPRPLSHPHRFRSRLHRLHRLLLLLCLGRCLWRVGILRRPPSPLLLSPGFGRLLFLLLRFLFFRWRSSSALRSSPWLFRLLLLLGVFGGFALIGRGFGGSFGFGRRRCGLLLSGIIFFIFGAVGVTTSGLFFDIELGLVLHDVVAGAGEVNCRIIGLSRFLDGVAAFGLDRDFAFGFLFGDFSGWGGAVPVPRGCG